MLESKPLAPLARSSLGTALLLIALPLLGACGSVASSEGPGGGNVKSPDLPAEASFIRVGEVRSSTGMEAEVATAASAAPSAPDPKSAGEPGLKRDENKHGAGHEPETKLAEPPHLPGDAPHSVRGAVVDSQGGLSEAEVRSTIVQRQGSFRECYEIGTRASSSFSGTVELRVSITGGGSVGSVEVVSSTTKNSQVDSCVAEAVRKIAFPAKGGGAVVGFPIAFGS